MCEHGTCCCCCLLPTGGGGGEDSKAGAVLVAIAFIAIMVGVLWLFSSVPQKAQASPVNQPMNTVSGNFVYGQPYHAAGVSSPQVSPSEYAVNLPHCMSVVFQLQHEKACADVLAQASAQKASN